MRDELRAHAGIPELVASIFKRLEVEPSHGLNFDGTLHLWLRLGQERNLFIQSTFCVPFVWRTAEFCVTVKSQPLLLECFSQQALDARAREDEASAERAVAIHGLENFESKMMAVTGDGKKAKWKECYFVPAP